MTKPKRKTKSARRRRVDIDVEKRPDTSAPPPDEEATRRLDREDADADDAPSPVALYLDELLALRSSSPRLYRAVAAEYARAARSRPGEWRMPSVAELARRAGVPESTARSALGRARNAQERARGPRL